jgi:prolyl oligopeptidase
MHAVMPPPFTPVESVTDVLHGVPITDPYRWLEDQTSSRTRAWIDEQSGYTRNYFQSLTGREKIRERVREFLAVETYDSLQKSGGRYFFRKRLPEQEQPCIYLRDGTQGEDQLLLDPSTRGTGKFTALKPLYASPDGGLLVYEVKEGGERAGIFEIFDVEQRRILADRLPHGYLRSFAFAPGGKSFYYVHEATAQQRSLHRAAYQHVLGAPFEEDRELFCAGEGENLRLRLIFGDGKLGFLVLRFLERTSTDFYMQDIAAGASRSAVILNTEDVFGPMFWNGRILALTDKDAPNRRIVEIHPGKSGEPRFVDVVPESDSLIQNWVATKNHLVVSYVRRGQTEIEFFTPCGKRDGKLPAGKGETVRLTFGDCGEDEVFFESESFRKPIGIHCYQLDHKTTTVLAERKPPLDSPDFACQQVSFKAKDGKRIPAILVGRRDVLGDGPHPAIMTSYGGFGISVTPQFSVFVAFLMEKGCLFALPNIRGGSEFGAEWHKAAQRRNRQVAFDDFISAAEWLVESGRTEPGRLAIFGGSNSGLLVGAAMTQRPDLFRAVVCLVPILDMLRYHLFDGAHLWKEELGTVEEPEDFRALHQYSPYHSVQKGVAYPATLIVSGDADHNCNPLHARKMTAALQAANRSVHPILLDYSKFRGHSPVLPLSERIEALTDRMAFLCKELGLSAGTGSDR